jgi:hypothetical protein
VAETALYMIGAALRSIAAASTTAITDQLSAGAAVQRERKLQPAAPDNYTHIKRTVTDALIVLVAASAVLMLNQVTIAKAAVYYSKPDSDTSRSAD